MTHAAPNRRPRPARSARPARAWFLVLAALATLTMPSLYAGGAEAAHAHAFFQFWLPESGDPFDHHDHRHLLYEHEGHEHPAPAPGGGCDACGELRSARTAGRDQPAVSPAAPAGGVASAAPLASGLHALLAPPVTQPWRPCSSTRALTGRDVLPESPPP